MRVNLNRILVIILSLNLIISCTPEETKPESLSKINYTPIVYDGLDGQAVIDETNATEIINEIIGSDSSLNKATASRVNNSKSKTNNLNINKFQHIMLKFENPQPQGLKKATPTAIKTQNCSDGGSYKYLDSREPNGLGDVITQYSNCTIDAETVSGQTTLTVKKVDASSKTAIFSVVTFEGYKYVVNGLSYELEGTLSIRINLETNTSVSIFNFISKDNASNKTLKVENLVITTVFDNMLNPSTMEVSQSGRLYHPLYGYVDISTPTSLQFRDVNNSYPDDGEIVVTGANESKVSITYVSRYKASIKIDEDGNNQFEVETLYLVSDIGGTPSVNEAPVLTVMNSNSYPVTTTDINLNITTFDIDGDGLTLTIKWYKNNQLITNQTGNNFPFSLHKKNDEIKAVIKLTDGNFVVTEERSYVIGNSKPEFSLDDDITVVFGDSINLSTVVSDADGDLLTYKWEVITSPNNSLSNNVFSNVNHFETAFIYNSTGEYEVRFSVNDTSSTFSKTIKIIVVSLDMFETLQQVTSPVAGEAIAIGDVNADGLNDVVIASAYSFEKDAEYGIFVFQQLANGALSKPIEYSAGLTINDILHINSLSIRDINSDGLNDVVFDYKKGIGIFLQNSSGLFNNFIKYDDATDASTTRFVLTDDFNNDGLVDVVKVGFLYNIHLYLQNDNGSLNSSISYTMVNNSFSKFVDFSYGDLNHDGLKDIVLATEGSPTNNPVLVAYQQADNTFTSGSYLSVGENASGASVATGDINNDRLDDLIVAHGGENAGYKLSVFQQNNDGTLTVAQTFVTSDKANSINIADVNNDGLHDLIVSHNNSNTVGIYLQSSDNTILAEQLFDLKSSKSPSSVAVGDINNDGKVDIVGVGSDIFFDGLSILKGK